MKRTADEIFSLMPRVSVLVYDGEYLDVTGHNEDVVYCQYTDGDEVYLTYEELSEHDVDLYEQKLITD